VILGSSQLLEAFSGYARYADALHDAAMATITGEPLSADGDFGRLLEVLLAAYSVVVFAALAASLGYFLNRERIRRGDDAGTVPEA
jgi:voltage-gated potassium channel